MKSYINITKEFLGNDYQKKWQSEEATIWQYHFMSRGLTVLTGVATPFTTALDTIIGLGAFLGAGVTLGRIDYFNKHMSNHLHSFKVLPSRTMRSVVKFFKPKAKFGKKVDFKNGLITECVKTTLNRALAICSREDSNIFNRKITTRLIALLQIVASITRIADFCIGLVATLLVVITLGSSESINDIAFRGLQITGLVTDILEACIKFLNPSADLRVRCKDGTFTHRLSQC